MGMVGTVELADLFVGLFNNTLNDCSSRDPNLENTRFVALVFTIRFQAGQRSTCLLVKPDIGSLAEIRFSHRDLEKNAAEIVEIYDDNAATQPWLAGYLVIKNSRRSLIFEDRSKNQLVKSRTSFVQQLFNDIHRRYDVPSFTLGVKDGEAFRITETVFDEADIKHIEQSWTATCDETMMRNRLASFLCRHDIIKQMTNTQYLRFFNHAIHRLQAQKINPFSKEENLLALAREIMLEDTN